MDSIEFRRGLDLPFMLALAVIVGGACTTPAVRRDAAEEANTPATADQLAEILDSLGIPFVPPGFRERFHVGRVDPPSMAFSSPPLELAFMPAEWEPATGVFVAWPRNLPDELLLALADNVPLQVLAEEGTEKEAAQWFGERVDSSRFRILTVPPNSGYPRDAGPQMVFDGGGRAHLIEQPSRGAPQFSLDTRLDRRDEPTLTLWEPTSLNEGVSPAVARQLNLPLLRFGGFITGGNFLVDGVGAAFYSDAQLDENYPILPPADFEAAIARYLGISRPVAIENFAAFGIQHADTWMKVLDPYRILVMQPPPGHPEEARTERNLNLLREMTTFDGQAWEILRIETPAVSRPREWPRHVGTAAYTNSLILNGTIYVPLYGIPEDTAALETWRRVMPGYDVLGFEFEEWRTFDAIHCRTRALFDPEMLRITPAGIEESSTGEVRVRARIVAYNGSDLIRDELTVHWRIAATGAFAATALVREADENLYRADLPLPGRGERLEYYFTAVDRSGRRQSAPPAAPGATYSFAPVR